MNKSNFTITISDVVIDIDGRHPTRLQDFYHNLLSWEKKEMYGMLAVVSDSGFALMFQPTDTEYIPPIWPEQENTQQKQMHLDFEVSDLEAATARALELGATESPGQYAGDGVITMFDPEGHPFCLCRADE